MHAREAYKELVSRVCLGEVGAVFGTSGPFRRDGGDGEFNPPQIAERLGVSHDTVYDWIRRGTLPARRGPGGRLWVQFWVQRRGGPNLIAYS